LYTKYANDLNSPYLYLIKSAEEQQQDRKNIEKQWELFANEAKKVNPEFKMPVLSYSPNAVIGKTNGLDNGNILYID